MNSILFWTEEIFKFLRAKNFKIDPLPKVELRDDVVNDKGDILIKTGYYDPIARKIVLFTNGRHIKDILRSFVHEVIHHHQNIMNHALFMRYDIAGAIKDNQLLRKIESEAYLLGNLYFRMFTEEFTMKNKK